MKRSFFCYKCRKETAWTFYSARDPLPASVPFFEYAKGAITVGLIFSIMAFLADVIIVVAVFLLSVNDSNDEPSFPWMLLRVILAGAFLVGCVWGIYTTKSNWLYAIQEQYKCDDCWDREQKWLDSTVLCPTCDGEKNVWTSYTDPTLDSQGCGADQVDRLISCSNCWGTGRIFKQLELDFYPPTDDDDHGEKLLRRISRLPLAERLIWLERSGN